MATTRKSMLTLKDELEEKAFEKREYKTVAAAKAAEKKWGPVWEEQTRCEVIRIDNVLYLNDPTGTRRIVEVDRKGVPVEKGKK